MPGRTFLRAAATAVATTGLLVSMAATASAAEPPSAPGRPGAAPAILPGCDYAPPPNSTFDSFHSSCDRCLDAGRALEATGRWRARCSSINPTLIALYRY